MNDLTLINSLSFGPRSMFYLFRCVDRHLNVVWASYDASTQVVSKGPMKTGENRAAVIADTLMTCTEEERRHYVGHREGENIFALHARACRRAVEQTAELE